MTRDEILDLPVGTIVRWTDGDNKLCSGKVVKGDYVQLNNIEGTSKYVEFTVVKQLPINWFVLSDLQTVEM